MEIIDVHSHIVSPQYLNVLKKYGKENEDPSLEFSTIIFRG